MTDNYDDIMNLPHHVSSTRPLMPMIDRAAQFSPFAALTGYDAAIKETGRLTDTKIELDEDSLNSLDLKYQLLLDRLDEQPRVTFTYFKPDKQKSGGKYVIMTDSIKKVDEYGRMLITVNGTKIPMDNVLTLESEMFSTLD
jgi:hypothetical protein